MPVLSRVWRIYSNIRIFSIRIFIRIFVRIKILIRIYSDIRSCQKCSYKYIRIFVRVIFLTRIYSDIRSFQNPYECHTLLHWSMVEKPCRAVSSSGWTGQGRLRRSCCLFKIRTRVFGLLVIQIYFNVIGYKYCDGLSSPPFLKFSCFFGIIISTGCWTSYDSQEVLKAHLVTTLNPKIFKKIPGRVRVVKKKSG